MSRLETALRDVAAHLERRRRRWAVVGGLAVSARAEPRFTRDVDLALMVADDADAAGGAREPQTTSTILPTWAPDSISR